MKSRENSPLGFYTVCIAALFMAGFLLLVIFGARSFKNTSDVQNDNMQTRAILSYLATCVKANDTRDAVSVRSGDEGQILEIADGDTGYALRVYRSGSVLLEEYAAIGEKVSPDSAEVIGSTKRFEIHELADDLLEIETDAGSVLVHLRSEEGAAG